VSTLNVSAASTSARPNDGFRTAAELGGRVLLAAIFLASGLGKVAAYAATVAYMQASGVPGALLPLVIAAEILGSLAVILGWQTRIASFALAGFSLLAAALFHNNFADQIQMVMFLKNVAIAGGFLLLVANGPGRLSIDSRFTK
jgi:putative oxidoreductase